MTGRERDWWLLTPRELDVLQAGARGESIEETAKRTFHAAQTIKFHRTNLFRKLGARNIAHAVAIAYEQGILTEGTVAVRPLLPLVTINGVDYVPSNGR